MFQIALYPFISSDIKLFESLWWRAAYYLPSKLMKKDVRIIIGSYFPVPQTESRPHYFGSIPNWGDPILMKSEAEYKRFVQDADLVLCWSLPEGSSDMKLSGKKSANISLSDSDSKEYGVWGGLAWDQLEDNVRNDIKSVSISIVEKKLRAKDKINRVGIVGTGPSNQKYKYALRQSACDLVIGCNTLILDEYYKKELELDFVCMGDAISHFGISHYASSYREKLAEFLEATQTICVSTARFAYLFTLEFPHLKGRVCLFEQDVNLKEPASLTTFWKLPALDSVLNIHMFPLALSVTPKEIILTGFDGKSKNADENEDFWPHAKETQLHELVETGHLSHPTFRSYRSEHTLMKYFSSTQLSVDLARARGISMRHLGASTVPSIAAICTIPQVQTLSSS